MLWAALTDSFDRLPGCGDDLFRWLWSERGLKFDGDDQMLDSVDEYSARLVCAALTRRESLMVVLPDSRPHRPALLFVTALIRHLRDSGGSSHDDLGGGLILYFGSTVGIRKQLGRVTITKLRKLDLAEVFRQRNVGRRKTTADSETMRAGLPQVFTIYAPVDPVAVMREHKPRWIALDCGDEPRLSWLQPLLHHAAWLGIPVIAWSQNPLSECVAGFGEFGQVFCWPPRPASRSDGNLESIFGSGSSSRFQPLVLDGAGIEALDRPLQEVSRLLARAARRSTGRLARDALGLHWRYLNALATLCVPVGFYEEEAPRSWGMKSFSQLRGACDHFRRACGPREELTADLEQAGLLLDEALELHRDTEPPMWHALCSLSIEELAPEEERVITFTGRARKQMFLLALLARCNLTEDDLRTVRTWVMSLEDLRRWLHQSGVSAEVGDGPATLSAVRTPRLRPLLAGLPGLSVTPKLLPVLTGEVTDILLYPHQVPALLRRGAGWARALGPDLRRAVSVLERLDGTDETPNLPQASPRLHLEAPAMLDVGSVKVRKQARVETLWQPEDPVEAVSRLFQTDEDAEELPVADRDQAQGPDQERDAWCGSAVEVSFEEGWWVRFASDALINAVATGPSGLHLDKRYARSLRPGDRVMLIHGQRRQDLYDLIISRVHRDPSIELHLALIRRWHEDFVVAYRRWRRHGVRNLDTLLRLMQQRGSSLTSSFTLRQWLWGHTLCPEDPEDLRRLAEALDMYFARQYHRRIHHAAGRLRGLHRGLSKRLNRWLEQQILGTSRGRDDDLIDADLGLTFGDFRNSLLMLKVTSVAQVSGPFLYTSLGRPERSADDGSRRA